VSRPDHVPSEEAEGFRSQMTRTVEPIFLSGALSSYAKAFAEVRAHDRAPITGLATARRFDANTIAERDVIYGFLALYPVIWGPTAV